MQDRPEVNNVRTSVLIWYTHCHMSPLRLTSHLCTNEMTPDSRTCLEFDWCWTCLLKQFEDMLLQSICNITLRVVCEMVAKNFDNLHSPTWDYPPQTVRIQPYGGNYNFPCSIYHRFGRMNMRICRSNNRAIDKYRDADEKCDGN